MRVLDGSRRTCIPANMTDTHGEKRHVEEAGVRGGRFESHVEGGREDLLVVADAVEK